MFLSAVVLSFVACLAFTPIARVLALRFGFLDHPDGARKLHIRATPLGGGVALFASLTLAIGVAYTVPNSLQDVLHLQRWTFCALFLCCALIVAIGLADDRFGLRGWRKLLGQLVAAAILVTSGLFVDRICLFNYEFELGLLSVPFTLFWLVGAINAINLLDGIDGLASSVGIVLSVAVSVLGIINGHPVVVLVGLALAGSLSAFACFNFPPAKIYLGDTGSMLIGLIVGALTLQATSAAPAKMAIVPALAVWAIPVFDTTVAIIRRKLAGRSLYTTDRDHLHHRLLTLVGSHRLVLGIIVLCCAATCAGSLLSVHFGSDMHALLSALLVVGTLVATRCFGCAELLQLAGTLKAAALDIATNVFCRSSWIAQVTQPVDVPPQEDCDMMRQFSSTFQTTDSWIPPNICDQVVGPTEWAADPLQSALEEPTVQAAELLDGLQEQIGASIPSRNDASKPAHPGSRPSARAGQGQASVDVKR